MRISVWSSDVCSADLARREAARPVQRSAPRADRVRHCRDSCDRSMTGSCRLLRFQDRPGKMPFGALRPGAVRQAPGAAFVERDPVGVSKTRGGAEPRNVGGKQTWHKGFVVELAIL